MHVVVPFTVVQFSEELQKPLRELLLLPNPEKDDLERDPELDLDLDPPDLPLCSTVQQIRRAMITATIRTLFLDIIDTNIIN